MHVNRTRNSRDSIPQRLRDLEIVCRIASDDLQIDRRRQTEIQNLVRNVCRLEEEHHIGKDLVQPLSQQRLIFLNRPVLFPIQ